MSEDCAPGSRYLPYNLAIVGGGPAGSAIILRAIHLGFANELLSGKCRKELDLEGNSAGVCIFEKGSKARFGGGRLQDYQINSNTNGAKFVTNLTHDRPNVLPPEIATGTELEQTGKSKLAKMLLEYRATTAPLDQIGKFLVEVGDVVLNLMDRYHPTSAYHCETEVIKIQQFTQKIYQNNTQYLWKITAQNHSTNRIFETYSRYVVLSSGGKQTLPRLSSINHNSKLLSSDYVCSENGIHELTSKLKNHPRKRIVIIGGSHSAFSAAWICLNKLGWYSNSSDTSSVSSLGNTSNPMTSSSNHSIYIVHRHEIRVFYPSKRDADRDKYASYEGINKQGQIHPFSGLRGDAKALYKNIRTGVETRVRLLAVGPDSSNHQTLYTRLCDEAHVIIWACGYEASLNYSIVTADDVPIPIHMTRGQVEIDDMAQVLLSPTNKSVTPAAVSTETPSPPDSLSPSISPSVSVATNEPIPIKNLLATGLGFGLNVSGDTNSSVLCKADGVAVYLKRAATLILSHVLGTKVFGEGLCSWEQHVIENVRRWNEQQALLRASKASSENNDDENEYFHQLNVTSPISPSKQFNRSATPSSSSPLITSPIRRQIRTASTDITRRKNQIGITNSNGTPNPPRKIPPSPISDKKHGRGVRVNSSITIQIESNSVDQPEIPESVSCLDNGDSDPFDLYISGLVSSLETSNDTSNLPPFSPLQSPKLPRNDTFDCCEDPPPPPYTLDLGFDEESFPIKSARSDNREGHKAEKLNETIFSVTPPLSVSNNSSPVTPRKLRHTVPSPSGNGSPNQQCVQSNLSSKQLELSNGGRNSAWVTTATNQSQCEIGIKKISLSPSPPSSSLGNTSNQQGKLNHLPRKKSTSTLMNPLKNSSLRSDRIGSNATPTGFKKSSQRVPTIDLASTLPSSSILSKGTQTAALSPKVSIQHEKFPSIVSKSHESNARQTSNPPISSLQGVKKLLIIKSSKI